MDDYLGCPTATALSAKSFDNYNFFIFNEVSSGTTVMPSAIR
jgi:hypothetical protein